MTKKYISFSDQAKNIGKKYPRRKYDKIEQESYERDMENLIELQEQYKKENGFGTEETQNYGQDIPQFDGYGNSILPRDKYWPFTGQTFDLSQFYKKAPDYIPPGEKVSSNLQIPTGKINTSKPITNNSNNIITKTNISPREPLVNFDPRKKLFVDKYTGEMPRTFTKTETGRLFEENKLKDWAANQRTVADNMQEESTSLLPSYLSAGAGIVGNLSQMLLDKKPQKLITPTYQPERLDLSEERNLAEKQAIESGNIARRNLREGTLSTGQMLANLGVTEAGIQGTKGNVLTGLGTAEKQYNVGATNQANQYAAEAKAKDMLINQQLQDAWKQRQLQYLSGAIGIVPQTIADINRIKEQDKYLSQLSTAERNKLKALNAWFPNYYLGEGNIPSFRK